MWSRVCFLQLNPQPWNQTLTMLINMDTDVFLVIDIFVNICPQASAGSMYVQKSKLMSALAFDVDLTLYSILAIMIFFKYSIQVGTRVFHLIIQNFI